MNGELDGLRKKSSEVRKEVRKRIAAYIVGGFGLVAALAWNDAIKALIESLLPLDKNALWGKFIYAFIATLLIVILSVVLFRSSEDDKEGYRT